MRAKQNLKPDFRQIAKVLNHEKPDRPVLFEFYLNQRLDTLLAGRPPVPRGTPGYYLTHHARWVEIFRNAGYDYATIMGMGFDFPCGEDKHGARTKSLNEGAVIHDRASFNAYPWPDPDAVDLSPMEALAPLLDGAKLMPSLPNGVLENAIRLVGYDALCFMIVDDPELAKDIFDAVGSRLLRYVERTAALDVTGIIMANDDWGFRSQTMLSPDHLRTYVFPWHKRIVATAHHYGKPAVLHSCGFAGDIMPDIIHDMKFDGKHSFEDAIEPIETAYGKYAGDIALLGGIDVNFMVTASPDAIYARAKNLIALSGSQGNYALGTGNSVPDYIPDDHYFAMTAAALESR